MLQYNCENLVFFLLQTARTVQTVYCILHCLQSVDVGNILL